MRAKVEDAMTSLALTRGRSKVREAYLTRRWGHHVGVMSAFKVICQEQVEEAWKEKGDKCTSKLQHLEMKWKREERHRTQKLDIGGEWRGVKIGDRELEEEEERRDRGERRTRPVLKYGAVVTSAEEDSLLSLPAKFSTYQAITLEKVEVALQVSMAKARWELQSRKERGEGEAEEEQEWSEDWELAQQVEKTVYSKEEQKIDFSKRRVTDMKTCRSVFMPQPGTATEELVIANIVSRGLACTKQYIEENCDKKGFPRRQNLSEASAKGMKSLLNRAQNKEIVLTTSDKSGSLAICSRDIYIQSMKPHFESDPEQTWEQRRKLEDQVNAHTIQMGRILRMGEKWGHWERVKSALICHFSAAPLLQGYVKDHKVLPPGDNPVPLMRPVCSALESNNGALSDILAEVCTTLGDEMDMDIKTLCLSTEEMIVGMEMVNTKKEEIHKLVVMSMDVEKMYPMMKASKVAQVVADEYRKSSFKVEVDPRALSLYLAIMIGREELVERGLGDVTHTKKRGEGGRGRKIGITTAEVTQETVPEDKKLFFPPARKPTAPLQVVWQENDQPLADDEQLCPIRQSEEELSGADGLDETVQHQENLALESECRYLDRLLPQDEMVRLQRNLPR